MQKYMKVKHVIYAKIYDAYMQLMCFIYVSMYVSYTTKYMKHV
jgi:hypothetical protein